MAAELVPVQNHEPTTGKRLGGVTGKGFTPGNRANPGGRPKGMAGLAKRIQRETKDGAVVVDYLLKTLQYSRSPKERTDAATLLLAYGFGKPVQPTEITGEGGNPVEMVFRVVYADRTIAEFGEGDGRDD
jgi:hypothetical protein